MMMNDVVATIDIATENTLEVQKNINKSTREQRSRLYSATDISEIMDANRRHEELEELYAEVTDNGEITKLIHRRLYVPHIPGGFGQQGKRRAFPAGNL